MDWFRMYGEFASDPKVQSMSEAMQRRLMMLLCLRCSNTLVTLQDDEIAFALRISDEELDATKTLFIRKGFINDAWEISNWDKRQFVSDSSKSRVAKHRAGKKDALKNREIIDVTPCNVTETPQIQNRTDTEQIQNKTETTSPVPVDQKNSGSEKLKIEDFASGSEKLKVKDLICYGVDEQTAKDWFEHRKTKKASVSKTVLDDRKNQALIAGLSLSAALRMEISRGWQGFEAAWVPKPQARASPERQSRHAGFSQLDYSEGVTEDGRIA